MEPKRQTTYADYLTKIDTILGRVPVKLQECLEQITESRQLFIATVNMYEKTVNDLKVTNKKYEELLAKNDVKLLPDEPKSKEKQRKL